MLAFADLNSYDLEENNDRDALPLVAETSNGCSSDASTSEFSDATVQKRRILGRANFCRPPSLQQTGSDQKFPIPSTEEQRGSADPNKFTSPDLSCSDPLYPLPYTCGGPKVILGQSHLNINCIPDKYSKATVYWDLTLTDLLRYVDFVLETPKRVRFPATKKIYYLCCGSTDSGVSN